MRNLSLTAVLLFIATISLAQARLVTPIEGELGEDFIIVNYVDWGPAASVHDHYCLSKAYNGHQGTDFVLKSFRAMDEGVNVLAADTGVVIFTHDGEFDREKVSVISKGLGNYIGLTHSGDVQTYYGHLKKNSILVEEGDTVFPGDVIGQVASSGNSTDPHLHFELWYDSTYYIDPFQGPCGNGFTYWLDPLAFDSSFQVWTSSTWDGIPFLDTLREAPFLVDSFDASDEQVTYWALLYGLRNGDSISMDWYTPDDSLWQHTEYQVNQDWWYYYEWSELPVDSVMPEGQWTARLSRNQISVDTRYFQFFSIEEDTTQDSSTAIGPVVSSNIRLWQQGDYLMANHHEEVVIDLFDVSGRLLRSAELSAQEGLGVGDVPQGIYIAVVSKKGARIATKKVMLR